MKDVPRSCMMADAVFEPLAMHQAGISGFVSLYAHVADFQERLNISSKVLRCIECDTYLPPKSKWE